MKYTHVYKKHNEDEKKISERYLQSVTINGKEIKGKDIDITYQEKMINFDPEKQAGRISTSINITIKDDEKTMAKKEENKKKREKALEEFKQEAKKRLLLAIGTLFRDIAMVNREINVKAYMVGSPSDKTTYGIPLSEDKCIFINSLFHKFKEIDELKIISHHKIDKMINHVRGVLNFYCQNVPQSQRYEARVKAKQINQTKDMKINPSEKHTAREILKNIIGVDFGEIPPTVQSFNIGFKNGKIVIQEI